jgi:hypothetical protein
MSPPDARAVRYHYAAPSYTIIGLQQRILGAMLSHALHRHAWAEANDIIRAPDRKPGSPTRPGKRAGKPSPTCIHALQLARANRLGRPR